MNLTMPGGIFDFFVAIGSSDFYKENPEVPQPDATRRCGRRGISYIWTDISDRDRERIVDHVRGYAEVFNGPGIDDEGAKDGRVMARWLKKVAGS